MQTEYFDIEINVEYIIMVKTLEELSTLKNGFVIFRV